MKRFMQHALRLAEANLGRTAPNPSVGCVIVKEDSIIGTGATARGGRPHAEVLALQQAGEQAKGAALYVTLEPCSHHGKSPPCMDAIIKAGIAKVVVACTDPNPAVNGKGIAALREAGIEVIENICKTEARQLNEGFFSTILRKRPLVTLKLATSLDGKIATHNGESQWITNAKSRDYVHLLRAKHDAILTGIGTIRKDDPALTCRLSGRQKDSPQRIIIDSKLQTPANSKALPAWILTSETSLEKQNYSGSEIISVPSSGNHLDLEKALETIAEKGITRLMIEAGSLGSAFLDKGLVDYIYWFKAPLVIGETGIPAIKGNSLPLASLSRYELLTSQHFDNDVLDCYRLNTPST